MTASHHEQSTHVSGPQAAWQPTTTADVAEAVQQALAQGQQVYCGHRPPAQMLTKPAGRISLEQFGQIVDYPARDMTITVQAGMTVSELHQILQQENQQLPIDFNDPDQTVGSLVATDTSGPRRFGYGTLRDYVIGIEAVDGQGRIFQAGGRVVKNVAGYDLCRLMIGSAGRLAVLTQLTFKLKPRPGSSRLAVFGFTRLSEVEAALEKLNLSAARPTSMEVMNRLAANAVLLPAVFDTPLPEAAVDCNYFLLFSVEGSPAVCTWQVETLQQELQSMAVWNWVEPAGADNPGLSEAVHQRIMTLQRDSEAVEWLARLTTLPSRVVSSISMLEPHSCMVFGRAGNGVLFFRREHAGVTGGTRPVVRNEHSDPGLPEATALGTLNHIVGDDIGALTVLKSGDARAVPRAARTARLITALCQTFDPHQCFSTYT